MISFFISCWSIFVLVKLNRGASRRNEMSSCLVPKKFSVHAIRFHSRTRKVWAAMSSISLLRKRISARHLYAWKESNFFPSVNLILYPVYLMLLFSLSLSYMTTTSTIYGEMLSPCSSLSCDMNVIVLNMHPCLWMRLTLLQQPVRHMLLAIVYPFF